MPSHTTYNRSLRSTRKLSSLCSRCLPTLVWAAKRSEGSRLTRGGSAGDDDGRTSLRGPLGGRGASLIIWLRGARESNAISRQNDRARHFFGGLGQLLAPCRALSRDIPRRRPTLESEARAELHRQTERLGL